MDMERKIIEIISRIKQRDLSLDLDGQSSILEDARLDSMEIISFVLEVEEAFDIEMDFEAFDIGHLSSVAGFADFIKGQVP